MSGKLFCNRRFYLIMLIISLLLSACAATGQVPVSQVSGAKTAGIGDVVPLSLYATIQGLQAVIKANPGTFAMQGAGDSDNLVMLAWPANGQNYAFAVFNTSGAPVKNIFDMLSKIGWQGQKTDNYTFNDMVTWLQARGWTNIDSSKIPATIVTAVQGCAVYALNTASASLPDLLILPIVGDPTGLLPKSAKD